MPASRGSWSTLRGLGTLALANYTPLPVLDACMRGADVFHSSVLVRRPPTRPRLTATIHDLTGFLMPELHPAANLRAERSFAEILRRADGLIAVSGSTRNDAVRVLGIAPEKIAVIHSGVADGFFECTPEAARAVCRRYRLERPFVLFVGTIEPRKNVDLLVDAFLALAPELRAEYRTGSGRSGGLAGGAHRGAAARRALSGLSAGGRPGSVDGGGQRFRVSLAV